MTKLTVALAQIYPKLGNINANLELHLTTLDNAASQGADLVIFPELSMTGYYLKDIVYELAAKARKDDPYFGPLLQKTAERNVDAVIGFVEEDERGRFFISAAYLSRGEVLHVHRKIYLPTYGLFDDGRFFAPGNHARAFETRFGRFGMLVCEDYWHMSLPYILWQDGADVQIYINSSPGRGLSEDARLASARWVEKVCEAYAGLFADYVIEVNRVGFEDGLVYWGGSIIVDPEGEVVARAPYLEEALTLKEIDLAQIRRTRASLPLLRDERPNIMLSELQRIIDKHGIYGK